MLKPSKTRFHAQITGVPKDGLVLPKMLTAVREWNNVDHQPWLVHCSAGIGRTGTLVGIDIGMESLESNKYVIIGLLCEHGARPCPCKPALMAAPTATEEKNSQPETNSTHRGCVCAFLAFPVPCQCSAADAINIIEAMRVGRGGMVQTPEQYEFVHKCLEDYALLRNVRTHLSCSIRLKSDTLSNAGSPAHTDHTYYTGSACIYVCFGASHGDADILPHMLPCACPLQKERGVGQPTEAAGHLYGNIGDEFGEELEA